MSSAILTLLLPPSSGYLFAYAFLLLAVSLALSFAGAFLTLDRTRSFRPSYDAVPGNLNGQGTRFKVRWNLQGGVGGIAIGLAFGLHCATFLAIMIPSSSNTPALGSGAFLATWILSSVPTAFVGGRWKLGALGLSGLTGGALFSLAFSIIIHPSLRTRVVLVSVGIVVSTLGTLLPLARTQHAALRFSTASTGAFGFVLSIALLANIPAWSNAWERLWIRNGDSWGTSQEKGLSAAFCLFLLCGVAVDWALRRKFGECPDEKWDHYLVTYSANLPDRQGSFQPSRSFWQRVSNRSGPVSADAKNTYGLDADEATLRDMDVSSSSEYGKRPMAISPPPSYQGHAFDLSQTPNFLKKARSHSNAKFQALHGRRKDMVKFNPNGDPLSSDDDDDDLKNPSRPWLRSISSTTSTLNDARTDNGPAPEYSDYEEDISVVRDKAGSSRQGGSDWSPGFIKKGGSTSGSSSQATIVVNPSTSSRTSQRDALDPPSFHPVPATPSLINALDRVSKAQKDAYMLLKRPGLPPSTSSASSGAFGDGLLKPAVQQPKLDHIDEGGGRRWDTFWKDVQDKASHPTR